MTTSIIYDVPLIPQSNTHSCWAACMAMILGWKQRRGIPDKWVTAVPGGARYAQLFNVIGLGSSDRGILHANGFVIEEPACFSDADIRQLMLRHGPLWVVTGGTAGGHVRVVRGISDDLYVNDPWPVNLGSRYAISFAHLFKGMENLGVAEMDAYTRAPFYVAHLP